MTDNTTVTIARHARCWVNTTCRRGEPDVPCSLCQGNVRLLGAIRPLARPLAGASAACAGALVAVIQLASTVRSAVAIWLRRMSSWLLCAQERLLHRARPGDSPVPSPCAHRHSAHADVMCRRQRQTTTRRRRRRRLRSRHYSKAIAPYRQDGNVRRRLKMTMMTST